MKAKTLLALASACTNDIEAGNLMLKMQAAFSATPEFRGLTVLNTEGYIEQGNAPFVRFEMVLLLSENYALAITPEIRNGDFVVVTCVNRFEDGHGLQSRNWTRVDDDEQVLGSEEDQTVARIAKLAKAQVVAQHAKLIESLGVPASAALTAAKKAWPVSKTTAKR